MVRGNPHSILTLIQTLLLCMRLPPLQTWSVHSNQAYIISIQGVVGLDTSMVHWNEGSVFENETAAEAEEAGRRTRGKRNKDRRNKDRRNKDRRNKETRQTVGKGAREETRRKNEG